METFIGDIKIYFSEDQRVVLDELKDIIQNNYELIHKFLGSKKKINLLDDESNFNDTFYYIVSSIYNNKRATRLLNDNDFLSEVYVGSLIRKSPILAGSLKEANDIMSDEFLSNVIAYKYFESNGTFNEFVEYLKTRNREEELFEYFKDNNRWYVFNKLLKEFVEYLKDDDNYYEQNNKIVMDYVKDSVLNEKTEIDNNYPKITDEEFDILFYDFMNYINAPDEWKNIYNHLKDKNLIIKDKSRGTTECFLDNDGIIKISLENGDNLKGFYDFIHEFIHYVSVSKKGKFLSKISTAELPSIFFQMILVDYFKEKNFSSNLIYKFEKERDNSNKEMCINLFPILVLLNKYMSFGKANKDDVISFQKLLSKDNDESFEEKANTLCDLCTNLLLSNDLTSAYQYLVGSYLAKTIYDKKTNDNSVVKKMIDITNNLYKLDTNDILRMINIDVYSNEYSKKKIKK